MGRGVSSGGGESSLGYLFGGGEETRTPAPKKVTAPQNQTPVPTTESPAQKPTASAPPAAEVNKEIPAGVPGNTSNNYFRADGQNCGNFITDRPSTKVHAAPGGGSSLDYLFGAGGGGK